MSFLSPQASCVGQLDCLNSEKRENNCEAAQRESFQEDFKTSSIHIKAQASERHEPNESQIQINIVAIFGVDLVILRVLFAFHLATGKKKSKF